MGLDSRAVSEDQERRIRERLRELELESCTASARMAAASWQRRRRRRRGARQPPPPPPLLILVLLVLVVLQLPAAKAGDAAAAAAAAVVSHVDADAHGDAVCASAAAEVWPFPRALAGAAEVDLQSECPTWLGEALSCPETRCPPRALRFRVSNASAQVLAARDLADARERFGECLVFAFLRGDPFSEEMAPLVLTLARVFPNVLFATIEGRRAGYLLGGVLPKSFPVLLSLPAAGGGRPRVFTGAHFSLPELLQFVMETTGEGPLDWAPAIATASTTQPPPGMRWAEGQVLEALQPTPPRGVLADPLFVLAAASLVLEGLLTAPAR